MSDLEFAMPTATGSIQWKDEKNEPGVDTKTLVDHRFALVQDMIDTATADFSSALDAMRQTLVPITVRDIESSDISLDGIDTSVPSFTGSFDSTFTATLEDFDVTYVEPEGKPDPADVEWEDGTIYLQTELVSKLAVWLTDGESAIPQTLFDQLYSVATTQYSEDIAARKAMVLAEAAAKGWDCPADVESARLTQLEREYSKGAAEVSGKIAERNMELIQANFHKAAELAVQYIQVQLDYVIRKNLAKIDWYSKAVEAWIKQVEATIAVIEAQVTAFNGKVEAYKAQALVYSTEAQVFEATVRAYAAQVEALKTKINAEIDAVKAEVLIFETDSKVAIENEKLRVDAQIANNELGQRIAEAEGNFHAQLMASGMGALHVQAGVSANHSTGEQVGFSYSYGQQYSEQQSRSETMNISREVE